jgi:hypothetical protein
MRIVAFSLKCTGMSTIDTIRSPGAFFMANTCMPVPKPEHDGTAVMYGLNQIILLLELYLNTRYDHSNSHSRVLVKVTDPPGLADVRDHLETTSMAIFIVHPQQICPPTPVRPVIEARKPPRHRRRPFRVVQVLHGPEV